MQSGGTTDNRLARRQSAKEAAKEGRGPDYWEPYHDGRYRHGQYVTSDTSYGQDSNQHKIIHLDNQDPELRDRWVDTWRGQKYIQGFRPSKRKAVK